MDKIIKLNGIYQSMFFAVMSPIVAYLAAIAGYKFMPFVLVYLGGMWTTALIVDYKKIRKANKGRF